MIFKEYFRKRKELSKKLESVRKKIKKLEKKGPVPDMERGDFPSLEKYKDWFKLTEQEAKICGKLKELFDKLSPPKSKK